jgi:hypothetical protein
MSLAESSTDVQRSDNFGFQLGSNSGKIENLNFYSNGKHGKPCFDAHTLILN